MESKDIEEDSKEATGKEVEQFAPASAETLDSLVQSLQAYLQENLPTVFNVDESAVKTSLSGDEVKAALETFLGPDKSLGSQSVLFAHMHGSTLEFTNEVSHSSLEGKGKNAQYASALMLKRTLQLDPNVSLQRQIHFLVLGVGDSPQPLETIYSFVHHGFAPLLRSYETKISEEENGSGEVKNGEPDAGESQVQVKDSALQRNLPIIRKRLNELDYAMRTCLQSMEIPEVNLSIDPMIAAVLEKHGEAAKKGNANLEELGLGEKVRDVKMLNRLHAGVNRWVKEIQKITKLEHDAGTGSVTEEVQFWHNLDRALAYIDNQVQGPGVVLTMEVLKQSGRALATILFSNDTGLDDAKKRVANHMLLMQEFPISVLVSATDVPQITEAITLIFTHLKKLKAVDRYPLEQALKLVESLSRDLSAQIVKVLTQERPLLLDYADFQECSKALTAAFETWSDHARQFRDLARQLAKRRSERLPAKLVYDHITIQDRLERITSFRNAHEKLRRVIEQVLRHEQGGQGGQKPAQEVAEAYQEMNEINPLDVSPQGNAAWDMAMKSYERKIDKVEKRIIDRLTDKLGAAKTADEMFRVFSKFNALFFRPRIRGAIQQFQARLITTVEQDIERLQIKFKKGYSHSQAWHMSNVRDIPKVSGAVIWARQIERQLDTLMKRIETVLGKGWEQHVDGRRLKETGAAFTRKLSTQQMFDQWMSGIQEAGNFEVTGRLFRIVKDGGKLVMKVNFEAQIAELFKEVRNLQWLGFRIPYTLKVISDEAKEKYPFATWLNATLRSYTSLLTDLNEADLSKLLSVYVHEVQKTVERSFSIGKGINWDSDSVSEYVKEFSDKVLLLQDKVAECKAKRNDVSVEEMIFFCLTRMTF